jgi:NTP pyrophosphatase (non-canonical NTP hydrolase)
MDKLKEIFELQKSFTEKFFKDKHNLTIEDVVKDKELKIKWNKEYVLALSKEVYEVLDEIDWKMHTSKKTEDVNDNVLEECVDVLKYLFGIIQLNGFSVDDLYEKFMDKSRVVEAKFNQEKVIKKIKASNKKIAFIDIDGVLADWPGGFLKWAGYKSLKEFKSSVDKKEQYRIKSEYRTCGIKAMLSVLDGAKEFMKNACEKYNVVLLTARPYKKYFRIYSDTIKWLKDNNICYDAIVFDEEKEKYIINNFDPEQVAFCLDDDISNANKLDDSGFEVYLKPNYGLYTQETLDRKINKGVKVIVYENKINDVLL